MLGIYRSTVAEHYVPYIRPQENGNKTDIRRAKLCNENGIGLRIKGIQPLEFKALNHIDADFDPGLTKKQRHTTDIVPRHNTYVNINQFQLGLGGDNSWGAQPHDAYQHIAQKYSYSFVIEPVE